MRTALFVAVLVIVGLYAFRRGGGPERWTAAVLVIGVGSSWIAYRHPLWGFRSTEPVLFGIDLVCEVAFLAIAYRANRRWPRWVAALQLTSLAAHMAVGIEDDLLRWTYQTLLLAPGWAMLVLLAAGTWRHDRRLHRLGVDASWRN